MNAVVAAAAPEVVPEVRNVPAATTTPTTTAPDTATTATSTLVDIFGDSTSDEPFRPLIIVEMCVSTAIVKTQNWCTVAVSRLQFFRALSTIRVTFLRMRDDCKIIDAPLTEKHLWYKYHRVFASSPVMIFVTSCLHCHPIR